MKAVTAWGPAPPLAAYGSGLVEGIEVDVAH